MISVIIRNFNNQSYLGRAIRSCLKQSVKPEIIVVDDASTDQSRQVIESFGNKIVSLFLDTNVGVAEAANIGIRNALGQYVILVDADDYIAEHTILFMKEILDKNHDIGFVYSDHIRVDTEENMLERVNLDTPEKIFRHGAGIMFRKSYLEKLGLYDRTYRNAEDFELLSRYMKQFTGYHLRIPFYRYTRREDSITSNEEARKPWEQKVKSN